MENLEIEKKAQICANCNGYLTREYTVPAVKVHGGISAELSAEKEMEAFRRAQASLVTDGITNTETEVGLEHMERYEAKHGLPKGQVTGKRGIRYETEKSSDGSVHVRLSPESDKMLTDQIKKKRSMSRALRGPSEV
jgi:hypothetical protein